MRNFFSQYWGIKWVGVGGGGWGSVIWRQPRPYCHKTILTSLLSREQSFTLISLLEVFLAAHFIQVRPLCIVKL